MNTIAIKFIAFIAVVLLLVGLGYARGHADATSKYLPQLEALKASINAASEKAKQDEVKYRENAHAIESDLSQRESAIRVYYRGLLSARDKTHAEQIANSAQVPDGITSELGTCRQSIEFIEGCALDANHVLMFQEWVRVNQLPVE